MAAGLEARHTAAIVDAFDLGDSGRLSDGPVASGRLGAVWRLDAGTASWAVKQVGDVPAADMLAIREGAAFQEAAYQAGVPTPAMRRSRRHEVIAPIGDVRVRVHEWVDLCDPDPHLDPAQVGQLVAGLHRVDYRGTSGEHPWYTQPVGRSRWLDIVAQLRERHAPFVDELDALVPELLALEAYLGRPARSLRTCHRDLWADNVRATRAGGLTVFDFDNAGLADPSGELAAVLYEFASADPARAGVIRAGYADAGGPGRVEHPTDFAMAIAQLAHIVEAGCRRWLAAETDAGRADNEAWVREFIDRPLTRAVIESLLAA